MLLFDFPDELIVEILSKLAIETDHKDRLSSLAPGHRNILKFARTSRRAWALAQPFLFSAVLLRRDRSVQMLRDLNSDDKRITCLKDLVVAPFHSQRSNGGWLQLHEFLRSLDSARLTTLHIEMPYKQDLDGTFEFWTRFRHSFSISANGSLWHASWANRLEQCHINFHGHQGQPSEVRDMIHVFDLPRLISLTLVGLDFSYLRHKNVPQIATRTSPVQQLSLHACRISALAWHPLLSLPRSLKRLSYFSAEWDHVRNDHNDGWPEHWRSMAALSESLTQHGQSLTNLDLSHYGFRFFHDDEALRERLDLTPLTALEDLTIKTHQGNAVSDYILLSQLPRSLRRLRIYEFPYQSQGGAVALAGYFLVPEETPKFDAQSRNVKYPNIGNRKLPSLEELSIAYWPSDRIHDDRPSLEAIGAQYREQNNWRFTVYRITEMRGAVPPYLWDEHIPSFIKVYDNTTGQDLWDSKADFELVEEKLMAAQGRRDEEEIEIFQSQADMLAHTNYESDEVSWGVFHGTTSSTTDQNIVPFPGWPDEITSVDATTPVQSQPVVVPPPPAPSSTNMAVIAAAVAMANASHTPSNSS